MILSDPLKALLSQFSAREEVEAIALAGSRAAGTSDGRSDFDLYVYLKLPLAKEIRGQILSPLSSECELDNRFWETEDDGTFVDGTPYELIYRTLDDLEASLVRVVERFQADTGYTTCFWANVQDSIVLFDRDGRFEALKRRFSVPFPAPLVQAIVDKNWPLLRDGGPSFYFQVEKALSRADFVSVNHRVSAFLASYFDLLFAVNRVAHPGEKKLLFLAKSQLAKLPVDFEKDILNLLQGLSSFSRTTLTHLDRLTDKLGDLLQSEGLLKDRVRPAADEKTFQAKAASGVENNASLTIYTDGGCIGNPGKGAWAFVVDDGQEKISASGGEALTTNNKMELQGVIEALTRLKDKSGLPPIRIHTDSQYVKNGITSWIYAWERNGWKTSAKEPVKNQELWQKLKQLNDRLKPQWIWVKGHAGNELNEFCDRLVRETMNKL